MSAEDVENYFVLDSPGYFLARDAERLGEIAGAADAVQIIVLVNKLFQSDFRNRIAKELLERHGKAAARKYLKSVGTVKAADYALEMIGTSDMKVILREVADEVKRQTGIGTGENTPTKAAKKAAKLLTRFMEGK